MGCPCGAEANLQLTPPWYHHSLVQGAKVTRRDVRRSSPAGCPEEQGKNISRTAAKQKMPLGRPWHRSRRQVEQWSIQLHPHACQRQRPLQPFTPSSRPCRSGVQVVSSPHPRRSDVLRCQPVVWRPLPHHNLDGDLPAPPCPRHPCRASQSPASPVVEGLDLYLPYLKHIWRLASIKTVCAWKLPSKTALYQWTFMRPKRCGGKKKTQCVWFMCTQNIQKQGQDASRHVTGWIPARQQGEPPAVWTNNVGIRQPVSGTGNIVFFLPY